MKKTLLYALAAGAILTCGCNCINRTPEALLEKVSKVYKDSTATPKQLLKAMTPYAEMLLEQACDTARSSTNKRLDAHWKASNATLLLADKVTEMRERNPEVRYSDFEQVINTLNKASSAWVFNDGIIFHEFSHMSAEGSEKASMGHFQIDVILPTEEDPEPCVTICFPDSAVDTPFAIFGEGKEHYPITDAFPKGSMQEGSPLFAVLGEDFLDLMLNYDLMYLGFRSDIPSDDSYDGIELTHIRLDSFQETYKAVAAVR